LTASTLRLLSRYGGAALPPLESNGGLMMIVTEEGNW